MNKNQIENWASPDVDKDHRKCMFVDSFMEYIGSLNCVQY